MSEWENYLKEIYFDPARPASLSGPDKLYQFVKKEGKYIISKHKIRKWLQRQEPYSLQRPIRRPATRTHINVLVSMTNGRLTSWIWSNLVNITTDLLMC